MDLADLADQQIEDRLQMALTQFRSQQRSAAVATGYALTCELCEEPIPAERHRLLSGCTTCVDCANLLEESNRLHGRNAGTWWY